MVAMELEMEARNPSSAAFRQQPQTAVGRRLAWVLSFAVPGLGMFTEGAAAACWSSDWQPCMSDATAACTPSSTGEACLTWSCCQRSVLCLFGGQSDTGV